MWEDLKSMKRQIIGGLLGMLVAAIIALIFHNVPDPGGYISVILGATCTLIGAWIGQYLDIRKEL